MIVSKSVDKIYVVNEVREQKELDFKPFHTWKSSDETIWIAFYRASDGILLRFPGLSDFLVSVTGKSVEAHPVPGTGKGTLEHLYHNQVLPLAISAQGKLSLHAACVATPFGAVGFLAKSGQGKSTLTTSFAAHGFPFLTDDSLILEKRHDGFYALPGHPSIRLWEDSEEKVMPETAISTREVDYTSKARVAAAGVLPQATAPARLVRIYVLGEDDEIRITRLGPGSAVAALVAQSFQLDVEDATALTFQFHALAGLCEVLDVFQLDYPRQYGRLDDVRNAVLDHLASERKSE